MLEGRDEGLENLKARMTTQQRKEMADLLGNELRRRESKKRRENSPVRSNKLGVAGERDEVRAIYQQMQENMKAGKGNKPSKKSFKDMVNRAKQKSSQRPLAPEQQPRVAPARLKPLNQFGIGGKALLMLAVAFFALLKVLASTGVVGASIDTTASEDNPFKLAKTQMVIPTQNSAQRTITSAIAGDASLSDAEKDLLLSLDKRRVELQRRNEILDQREEDLGMREKEIAGRLAELRSLTRKLKEHRAHKDNRYEARMEQLANVYGSMAPKEAAPLVGKLDDSIALALLQRMPGKRMGQILSLMPPERAIALTQMLTDKQKL